MIFVTTAIWGLITPEKSRASLPADGSYLDGKEKDMSAQKNAGLDSQMEGRQARQDVSERLPIVRVIGDGVHVYTAKRDGSKHVLMLSQMDVHGFIQKMQSAQQALRVRTSNLMSLETD